MLEPPTVLAQVEFSKLLFFLEFQEPCAQGLEALLQLRREFLGLGKTGLCPAEEVAGALSPPLSSDPVALRRYQRPGPAFVIHPPAGLPAHFGAGDRLALPVLFLGSGRQQVPLFARLLVQLGAKGLRQGTGRFQLVGIGAEDPSGDPISLWETGGRELSFAQLAPPILDARWWIERHPLLGCDLDLRFLTPARLITSGRPLFRPSFRALFPFILRRVSAMVFAHCALELSLEARRLIDLAGRTRELEASLHWADWRTLQGGQGLGGVVGRVALSGADLEEFFWILVLGSLFNLGKGASFAAGHFQLRRR